MKQRRPQQAALKQHNEKMRPAESSVEKDQLVSLSLLALSLN